MKKLISLTLALITLLLALASCTPTQGTAPSATPSAVPTETPTQSNNNQSSIDMSSILPLIQMMSKKNSNNTQSKRDYSQKDKNVFHIAQN